MTGILFAYYVGLTKLIFEHEIINLKASLRVLYTLVWWTDAFWKALRPYYENSKLQ